MKFFELWIKKTISNGGQIVILHLNLNKLAFHILTCSEYFSFCLFCACARVLFAFHIDRARFVSFVERRRGDDEHCACSKQPFSHSFTFPTLPSVRRLTEKLTAKLTTHIISTCGLCTLSVNHLHLFFLCSFSLPQVNSFSQPLLLFHTRTIYFSLSLSLFLSLFCPL